MANVKGDIDIGIRANEEVRRLFRDPSTANKRIGLRKNTLHEWASGGTPGGLHLARLYHAGADVIYILTGKRSLEVKHAENQNHAG